MIRVAEAFSPRLLTDLEAGVDNTTTKLDSSMKKLQKFIRDTEGMFHEYIFRGANLRLTITNRDQIWVVHSYTHFHSHHPVIGGRPYMTYYMCIQYVIRNNITLSRTNPQAYGTNAKASSPMAGLSPK
jgi:hypothetical protein